MQRVLLFMSLFLITRIASADVTILRVMMDAEAEMRPSITNVNRISTMNISVYIRANVTGSASQPGNVTMSASAVERTGGHIHVNPPPPTGTFNPNNGKMELIHRYDSGRAYYSFSTEYTAPDNAGRFKLTASAGGKSVIRTLEIKIPGLVALSPLTTQTYRRVGQTNQHPNNFYAIPDVITALENAARQWRTYWNGLPDTERARYDSEVGRLQINDCSLQWGGVFDVDLTITPQFWSPPHSTHRVGLDTDIRLDRAETDGGIPEDSQIPGDRKKYENEFYEILRNVYAGATARPHGTGLNRHYHVYWVPNRDARRYSTYE
ncbi:MAG: hypothetical protein OXL96_17765 [Candidatus Poribacteria bacterium]|nr:hypothetical protein [Candidatus Poribacteria bacterium]